ncbi:MAG: hypothetical protein N2446_02710 [Elusimicrobiales bacterium]|nr:hypothetical protein [Elusimicrobiales bacterium]
MEIYKYILDSLTSGIISFLKDGTILYANPMAKKILHISYSLENTSYKESFKNLEGLIDVIDDMIKNSRTIRRAEVKIKQSNFYLNIGYSSMQLKDENNNHIGYTIIFQDLSILYASK